MKHCFKCGAGKPLDDFYRHPQMADGHLNKCKDCTKRDVDERYRRLVATPEGLEAERLRGREKYHRLYGAGPNWTSPAATPAQKQAASRKMWYAIKTGRIRKPARCEDCGKVHLRLHGHHVDYAKPLAVAWLCPLCHRKRHATHPERVKGQHA